MKSYTIYMTHKMRSVQTVEAENEEESKSLAYEQSFESEAWEEIDTTYDRID